MASDSIAEMRERLRAHWKTSMQRHPEAHRVVRWLSDSPPAAVRAEGAGSRRAGLARAEVACLTGMGLLGLAVWWWAMASAPRYSYGPQQDMGNNLYFPLLLAVAVLGGWLLPARARLMGFMLGLPGLLLSPFTAPRGDDDGLWILIVPMLVGFAFLLAIVADGAGRVRRWTSRRA